MKNRTIARYFLTIAGSLAGIQIASAQSVQPVAPAAEAVVDSGDIVVTARRRGEKSIDVPAIVSAFSADQLRRAGAQNLTDIANLTPQLKIEKNIAAFGGAITFRGVASPTGNIASEAAVSINIDGVPLSNGAAVRLGTFDLGQVEILKGPQALFFGKNSSGGIVSLKAAEPTRHFESYVQTGYEFRANELTTEGAISGPLSKTLLARVAARYSDQHGYLHNDVPGVAKPTPGAREFGLRGSLTFEPDSHFSAALKATYYRASDDGNLAMTQRIYCPSGVPSGSGALPSITDCKPDDHFARGDIPAGTAVAAGNSNFGTGAPYSLFKQSLVALNTSYTLDSGISLNSITGYYQLNQTYADNNIRGPIPTLVTSGYDRKRTFSEELRLSSASGNALSWMIGGFYQSDHQFDISQQVTFAPPATLSPGALARWTLDNRAYSAFGQASYAILKRLSLSAGVRYTRETKRQSVNLSPKFLPEVHFKNVSPEVTLQYKPTSNVNVFASYKQGYKSGAFLVSSSSFAAPIASPAVSLIDNSYRQETVKGFEGGIKALLLDRRLRIDLAGYHYIYSDLQLSRFDPVLSVNSISNAAAAVVEGAEGSLNYQVAGLRGLSLSATGAYNRARYRTFIAPCFLGQTLGQGCTIVGPGTSTIPSLQDLSGRPLPRAPKFAASAGADYQTALSDKLKASFNGQLTYESMSFLSQELAPWGIRPHVVQLNAGAALGSRSESWQIAFIGKNLTNKRYGVGGFQESRTGNAATTGTLVGSPSDYTAIVNRGREIWLQVTVRPGR